MSLFTTSQIWAKLDRHAKDIQSLRLLELCRDADRVSALVAVHNSNRNILIADLSRQRLSLETINILYQLAASRDLRKFITQLAWGGQNSPWKRVAPKTDRQKASPRRRVNIQTSASDTSSSGYGSMHIALRVPRGRGPMLTSEGTDALVKIHAEWDRIQMFSDKVRNGQIRGVSGSMIRDVVVVGRGVAIEALKFTYHALVRDETGDRARKAGLAEAPSARIRRNLAGTPSVVSRHIHFLSSIDPVTATSLTSELDPAATVVVSIALAGNEETGLATKALKSWLLYTLGNPNRRPDLILEKHMLLVTGNESIASVLNKPESVFLLPDFARVESFTTFTAASLLPLSIVFGWEVVQSLIDGAHDMDLHLIESNPRRNVPVVLALSDIWNDIFLRSSVRSITPFSASMDRFGGFVSVLESHTLGGVTSGPLSFSSLVLDDGPEALHDRSHLLGEKVVACEMVTVMDTQLYFHAKGIGSRNAESARATQDSFFASVFAYADTLAFGSSHGGHMMPPSSPSSTMGGNICQGNRPSSILITGKLDAFSCGQLLALSEHRVAVRAHILGIDPCSHQVASALRIPRQNEIMGELENMFSDPQQEEEESSLHLSTRTILKHYAAMMSNSRSSVN